jgi:hypothetical protein
MQINWMALLVAAVIPLLTGFVWYHPRVFGRSWMRAAGLTEESMQGANMARIFSITLLLGFVMALIFQSVVIHQMHILSILANEPGLDDPNSEAGRYMADYFNRFGNHFRTFGHGAFHGLLTGLMLITPIVAINALFERRGFRYIAVNSGYWIVTLALMGGVISAWK